MVQCIKTLENNPVIDKKHSVMCHVGYACGFQNDICDCPQKILFSHNTLLSNIKYNN